MRLRIGLEQPASIESARLADAAIGMFAAYQDGLLTLDRIRRGGRQTVKVTRTAIEKIVGRIAIDLQASLTLNPYGPAHRQLSDIFSSQSCKFWGWTEAGQWRVA